MNKEFNDWINDIVCDLDETCQRCCGEGLTNGQFINIEDTLSIRLKEVWKEEQDEDVLYVARDQNGDLYLYGFEPQRRYDGTWYDWDNGSHMGIIQLRHTLFPDLKWEDNPIKVKLIVK